MPSADVTLTPTGAMSRESPRMSLRLSGYKIFRSNAADASKVENEVLYEVADHAAVITLNAPECMNTISGPMLNDLARLLTEANEDMNVRVVILTGKGRAFCAGLDLRKECG